MSYLRRFFSWINRWITTFSSTNWKIATGMFLSVATMFFYFGSEIHCLERKDCRPIDSVNFAAWLSFVAAWASISYLQFAKKRDTYAAPSPDSERADVPATPAPTTAKKEVVPEQPPHTSRAE